MDQRKEYIVERGEEGIKRFPVMCNNCGSDLGFNVREGDTTIMYCKKCQRWPSPGKLKGQYRCSYCRFPISEETYLKYSSDSFCPQCHQVTMVEFEKVL